MLLRAPGIEVNDCPVEIAMYDGATAQRSIGSTAAPGACT